VKTSNLAKKGTALSSLLFNYALEYDIRKVAENKEWWGLNGTHRLLVYGNDVSTVAENINIMKKVTGVPLKATGEVGLEQCFSTAGPRPGTGPWASDR